jgi:hypothetical protein
MPITRLTPGSTFTFTSTSGSTDSISFINGTEAPFSYIFRNGIVTGVSNLNSASNTAYDIKDFASIINNAELYNIGTYRYGFRQISDAGTYNVDNSNINKYELIRNGSLFVIEGNGVIVQLPYKVPNLEGTCIKIINNGSFNTTIWIDPNDWGTLYYNFINFDLLPTFRGNIGSDTDGYLTTYGFLLNTTSPYASIELMSLGNSWLVTSYTGTWAYQDIN